MSYLCVLLGSHAPSGPSLHRLLLVLLLLLLPAPAGALSVARLATTACAARPSFAPCTPTARGRNATTALQELLLGEPATSCSHAWTLVHNALHCELKCTALCTPAEGPASLPACSRSVRDSDGCWLDSAAVTLAQAARHVTGPGGAAAATAWPRVWLPRACSYLRFTRDSFPSACARVARLREEASRGAQPAEPFYHLLLLGDSGGARGLYCFLYALLLHGTEKQPADYDYGDPDAVGCGGLYPIAARGKVTFDNQNGMATEINATHYLRFGASGHQGGRVFHFRAGGVRVSWAYVYGFTVQPKSGATVETIVRVLRELRGAGARLPDDVVLGAGAADCGPLARSPPSEKTLESFAAVGLARAKGAGTVLRAWAAYVNGSGAGARGGARGRAASRLWYRNNHCNVHFGAAAADEHVSPLFLAAGAGVLETFNFSVGYPDMAFDGFHYDRQPWKRAETFAEGARQHVGELTAQAAQSMLHNLCLDESDSA